MRTLVGRPSTWPMGKARGRKAEGIGRSNEASGVSDELDASGGIQVGVDGPDWGGEIGANEDGVDREKLRPFADEASALSVEREVGELHVGVDIGEALQVLEQRVGDEGLELTL